jgi:dihydroneopterin aldolase
MTADRIVVRGVEGFGYHGVLAEERANGQRFLVDLELEVDLKRAGEHDDLAATVDYSAVAKHALSVIEGEPFDLIETVAQRVAQQVLSDPLVESVAVTVHKPEAPVGVPFADVSVTVVRRR